jgi:hypothetical protein
MPREVTVTNENNGTVLLETTASDHTSQQMTCNIIAAAFY